MRALVDNGAIRRAAVGARQFQETSTIRAVSSLVSGGVLESCHSVRSSKMHGHVASYCNRLVRPRRRPLVSYSVRSIWDHLTIMISSWPMASDGYRCSMGADMIGRTSDFPISSFGGLMDALVDRIINNHIMNNHLSNDSFKVG